MLGVRLRPGGGGRFAPLRVDATGVPAPDPSREATRLVNRLGQQDFGGNAMRLLSDGSF